MPKAFFSSGLWLEPCIAWGMSPLMEILETENLQSYFQPIVSLKDRNVVGAEALARAVQPGGRKVTPRMLYQWAEGEGQLLQLDRHCRAKALQAFHALQAGDKRLLLFVNLETSVLELALRSGHFMRAVKASGLAPGNIVIEISESKIRRPEVLKDFVRRYRAHGFLIALDDLGRGHSNLARWQDLEPDIVKIDKSLVQGIAENYFLQERLKSIIVLSRRSGAMVLAEGVERQRDVEACAELGVELFQGYYFGRPVAVEQWGEKKAQAAAEGFARRQPGARGGKGRRIQQWKLQDGLLRELSQRLAWLSPDAFDPALAWSVLSSPLERVFVMDDLGLQVSSTVYSPRSAPSGSRQLFDAGLRGSNHASKDYCFQLLHGGQESFVSAPTVSPLTLGPCRIFARKFRHSGGRVYVAAAELPMA